MSRGIKRRPDDNSPAEVISIEERRAKQHPAQSDVEIPSIGGPAPPPPPTPPISPSIRKLAARRFNERVKLASSALSGLGIGLVSTGFLQLLLKDPSLFVREQRPAWYLAGIALHVFAHFVISTELRSED